jgi:hypothetical protein
VAMGIKSNYPLDIRVYARFLTMRPVDPPQ